MFPTNLQLPFQNEVDKDLPGDNVTEVELYDFIVDFF